jgi:hypothetical protein
MSENDDTPSVQYKVLTPVGREKLLIDEALRQVEIAFANPDVVWEIELLQAPSSPYPDRIRMRCKHGDKTSPYQHFSLEVFTRIVGGKHGKTVVGSIAASLARRLED